MAGEGSDLRLRVGAIEGGFAADGSEELPDLSKCKSLCAEVLSKRPDLYPALKERQTKLGIRLARCIKAAVDTPDSTDACLYAADEECFEEYAELFDVVIGRMHGLLPTGEVSCGFPAKRPSNLSPVKPAAKHLDPTGDVVHSVQLRAARNIRGFRFLPAMDRKEKAEVEMLVAKAVRGLAPAVTGVYLPLRQSLSYAPRAGGMDEFEERRLKAAGLLFDLTDSEAMIASGTCRDWPHGRGIFTSADRRMAVWINQQEHLKLMVLGQDLYVAYREMQRTLDGLGEILRRRQPGETQAFAWTERLGYLTSDLHSLGCSLEAAVILKLPRLADMEVQHPSSAAGSWRAWAGLMRVQVEDISVLDGRQVEHCFRICNIDTFNMSEGEVIDAVHEVASQLVIAEHKIQNLSDSDELFPIVTSDLATEGADRGKSLLSVFSKLVGGGNEKATEAAASSLIKANDATEELANADAELSDLKDRVKNAMISKLNDGSLDQAVETAAQAAGAQHFSDLPPLPPPMEAYEKTKPVDATVHHRAIEEVEVPKEDLSDLRRKTADLLTKAADTGELGKILNDVKKEMFVELRGKVATLLNEAADTGHLEQILGELSKKEPSAELRKKAANLLTQAAENGSLDKILAEKGSKKEPSADLRKKAAELLSQAAENGSLEKILAEKSQKEPSADLRKKAAELLSQAAENGSLEKILAEKSQKEPSADLRKKAAELLSQAAENGSLEKILAEKSQKEPSADLRKKAAELLSQAAEDGSLEKILAEKSQKEPSAELRKKAAALLSQAAEDGSLEKILAQKSQKEPSADLRKKAAALLSQAAADGSLEKVLQSKAQDPLSFQDDIADIRLAARESLLEAAQNGSLERVVSDMNAKKGSSSTTEIRQRAAQLLNQAAETGELQAVLNEVRSQGEADRSQVQKMLVEASQNGQLEKALEELHGKGAGAATGQETLAQVQKRTADLLAQAANNGDLERVLGNIRDNEEAETRKRIATALVEACDSGLLAKVLEEFQPQDMSTIRLRVQQQLENAAADGRLEHALKRATQDAARWDLKPSVGTWYMRYVPFQQAPVAEIPAPRWNLQPSVGTWLTPRLPQDPEAALADSLRKRMANALAVAVEDGNLESALLSVLEERESQGGDTDLYRKILRDNLIQSLEDGSLEKVLGEKKQGKELEALRRIEKHMLQALDDGSLEEAVASRQAKAQKEAKQAAKEGAFPKPKVSPLKVEEFSAKMFLEAFSEKGRRMNTLSKMIEEAESQIKRREQQSTELQAHISQNKLELAHLQLDLDWHRSALEGAEERRKELQHSQRKLLGTLHGKMFEISDGVTASSTICPSSPGGTGTSFQPRPPR